MTNILNPILPRDAWLEAVCATYEGQRLVDLPITMLPDFPSDTMQINTTGQAGRPTLKEAHTFYMDCVETFERLGHPITYSDRLLDFGVGWGRIGRFFLNEINPENLYGIDVDPSFIEVCKKTFSAGHFQACNPFPPINMPDNQFSFIVGYSVFSHLSEAACRAWMKEFHRLLAPNGIVALTTRGRWFFDFCKSLQNTATEGYTAALANLFPDFEEVKRRYDAGEIVFTSSDGVSGGGVRGKEFYGETFIPEAFAKQAFLPHMELIEFQFDQSRQTHPIMFFKHSG